MSNYTLNGEKFIIEDYTVLPAFSSFLPGLSGIKGIPVWSFYTNRGQAMGSFGINDKKNAMMEFYPANTEYEIVPIKGFRTFIRKNGEYFEPFCKYDPDAKRKMEIEKNVLTISEESHGIRITVQYITLPEENIGAMIRHVTIENTGSSPLELEILDGMPQVLPYGVVNPEYKEMSNLLRSWADIKNIENNAPVFTTRASTDDAAEITEVEGGFFYLAVNSGKLLPVIYDKNAVFDFDNSMQDALAFIKDGLDGVLSREQCFANKIPCAFIPIKENLEAGGKIEFTAFAGFAPTIGLLNEKVQTFLKSGYVENKIERARELVSSFTKDVWTKSANPMFDKYMEQCYLDNFLRGGYPFVIGKGDKKSVVHLFSRKHGDPERDYNKFSIAGEYYSQGNGNYRDVCQNRRNDVFFCPEIGDFNVRQFYSLIQMDGYNPLEIRPCTFTLKTENEQAAKELIKKHVEDKEGKIEKLIHSPFTPGQITNAIAADRLSVTGDEEELVKGLLELSDEEIEAGFGEGYWTDHWDYNLDLLDNYLLIYPDKRETVLFEDENIRFYDCAGLVRPRCETYVLNKGKVRQYGSMNHSKEKESREGFSAGNTNWLKDKNGNILTTTLFGKLIILVVNKFALLDSCGMGIEMEAGKPGWNDAMNGLPGLFGSSMPETLELKRTVKFVLDEIGRHEPGETIMLPKEPVEFMRDIFAILKEGLSDFECWDKTADRRESFRDEIKYEVSGEKLAVSFDELREVISAFLSKLDTGIDKAMKYGDGIMPTYFTFEATDYEEIKNEDGTAKISPYGLPSVKVKGFKPTRLPYFLEGPARMLSSSTGEDLNVLKKMYQKLKETDVYDKKLKMYKTSESIEGLSVENGRVRAFTPGWLERESIFLHMEYKYFLGLLNAGLYEEFYEAIDDALIPYQKPEIYGRSILENSSFLASSANPDPSVHGQGFVARLSGSTVEMISMWLGMFLGDGGFLFENGELLFKLAPKLPKEMFDENGDCSFMLLGKCKVTYHNESGKNTYGEDAAKVVRMEVTKDGGSRFETEGSTIKGEAALLLREGKISEIKAYLS